MAPMKKTTLRRGLALVEAAMVVPLLLMLLLGLLEYGWIFIRAQQVTNAARHGARIGALADSTDEEVLGAIAGWMNRAGISDYTVSPEPLGVEGFASGDTLTVTVVARNIRIIGVPLLPAPDTLRASVSMAKEGP